MKIKSLIIAIIFAVVCMIIANGVTAQRRTQRAPKPVAPKATPTPTPIPTPTPLPDANLQIEAGLVFKSGDVKPVARTIFYLFVGHPGEILRDGGVRASMRSANIDSADPEILLFNLALALRTEVLPDSAAFVKLAMPVLQPHIIQQVTTDFGGKAQFAPVKPGTYYLAGFAEVGRASATWNMKSTLNPGPTAMTLDNNNASDIHNRSY